VPGIEAKSWLITTVGKPAKDQTATSSTIFAESCAARVDLPRNTRSLRSLHSIHEMSKNHGVKAPPGRCRGGDLLFRYLNNSVITKICFLLPCACTRTLPGPASPTTGTLEACQQARRSCKKERANHRLMFISAKRKSRSSVRALREEALFLTADSFSRCSAGTCRPGRVRSR
jgi:hypothetical protein